jgi:transketolase
VYIFTHDSVFLGEDGPTHQPIEHLGALRLIPNLKVIRPADALETSMAWLYAIGHKSGPSALVLSRQNLPQLKRSPSFEPSHILRGGYILEDSAKAAPDIIIIATGSEVQLAQNARPLLFAQGIDARVVSMPSLEIFRDQDKAYQHSIIPAGFPRVVAIEASNARDWDRFLGPEGLFIGLTTFGHSAPWKTIAEHYGFTAEKVAGTIAAWFHV